MPTIVIIGFKYTYKPLQSSLTDIYIVYSYYRDLKYKIYIGSDIVSPEDPVEILNLYSSGIVDEYFQDFIRNFDKLNNIITDKHTLHNFFDSIEITKDNRLLFYYTGHGTKNNITLPDQDNYPSLELRNSIINLTQKDQSDIFIILDCCNPHGLYLPFMLSKEDFRYKLVGDNFITPKVLLMTSSDEDSKSEANKNYSFFTKELFSIFKDRKQLYSFYHIINIIDTLNKQKCTIRSSNPNLLIPWSWVVSKFLEIDINDQFDVITTKKLLC